MASNTPFNFLFSVFFPFFAYMHLSCMLLLLLSSEEMKVWFTFFRGWDSNIRILDMCASSATRTIPACIVSGWLASCIFGLFKWLWSWYQSPGLFPTQVRGLHLLALLQSWKPLSGESSGQRSEWWLANQPVTAHLKSQPLPHCYHLTLCMTP